MTSRVSYAAAAAKYNMGNCDDGGESARSARTCTRHTYQTTSTRSVPSQTHKAAASPLTIPDTLHHILYYLSTADLKVTRSVSRSWREASDTALQSRKNETLHLVLVLADWVYIPKPTTNDHNHSVESNSSEDIWTDVPQAAEADAWTAFHFGQPTSQQQHEHRHPPPLSPWETEHASEAVIREALKVGLVSADVDPTSPSALEAVEKALEPHRTLFNTSTTLADDNSCFWPTPPSKSDTHQQRHHRYTLYSNPKRCSKKVYRYLPIELSSHDHILSFNSCNKDSAPFLRMVMKPKRQGVVQYLHNVIQEGSLEAVVCVNVQRGLGGEGGVKCTVRGLVHVDDEGWTGGKVRWHRHVDPSGPFAFLGSLRDGIYGSDFVIKIQVGPISGPYTTRDGDDYGLLPRSFAGVASGEPSLEGQRKGGAEKLEEAKYSHHLQDLVHGTTSLQIPMEIEGKSVYKRQGLQLLSLHVSDEWFSGVPLTNTKQPCCTSSRSPHPSIPPGFSTDHPHQCDWEPLGRIYPLSKWIDLKSKCASKGFHLEKAVYTHRTLLLFRKYIFEDNQKLVRTYLGQAVGCIASGWVDRLIKFFEHELPNKIKQTAIVDKMNYTPYQKSTLLTKIKGSIQTMLVKDIPLGATYMRASGYIGDLEDVEGVYRHLERRGEGGHDTQSRVFHETLRVLLNTEYLLKDIME
ncbi:hypothetical protein HDV05_007170 [Chytridiales sp. JEL 0842]|nr:hypothetical protein HDV05_007170 [Chytridiales sp. JEL 0842]